MSDKMWQPGEVIVLPTDFSDEHRPLKYMLVVVCSCGNQHLGNPERDET